MPNPTPSLAVSSLIPRLSPQKRGALSSPCFWGKSLGMRLGCKVLRPWAFFHETMVLLLQPHPPLWQGCKVLRPWAFFHKTMILLSTTRSLHRANFLLYPLICRRACVGVPRSGSWLCTWQRTAASVTWLRLQLLSARGQRNSNLSSTWTLWTRGSTILSGTCWCRQ